MNNSSPKRRPPMSARNKMMDLLARRDHSEKEIRQKLKIRFPVEEIDRAIEYGKKHKWLPDSVEDLQKLAEKIATVLQRRGKGRIYINQYLAKKGLPSVQMDAREELEKALSLVENKFSDLEGLDREQKAKKKEKIGRFLLARGFDMGTVRKVIYEEL